MGEVLEIFSQIDSKAKFIRVLAIYNKLEEARRVAEMDDIEFKKLLPTLTKSIAKLNAQCDGMDGSVKEMLKGMTDEAGMLEVAISVLSLADGYTRSLSSAKVGSIVATDTCAEVAQKLKTSMIVERLSECVGVKKDGDNKQS